jgi:hypothetical protein
MYFARLWALSALAALCAMCLVLSAWLLIHLDFDVDETTSLMLGYLTSTRLVFLLLILSVFIGLIEATVVKLWNRRSSKRK